MPPRESVCRRLGATAWLNAPEFCQPRGCLHVRTSDREAYRRENSAVGCRRTVARADCTGMGNNVRASGGGNNAIRSKRLA